MKQFTSVLILFLSVYCQELIGQENQAFILFNLDACMADVGGSNKDFSEFTTISSNCSTLSVVGNNLYRTTPDENGHSCTPGVNGSIAMCVGADLSCEYTANSEKAIRFDIQVDPNESGTGQLMGLEFYQKSPIFFSWLNGRAGVNNTPTKYAVNVFVNGQSIFSDTEKNATTTWTKAVFDFSGNSNFTVNQSTVFSFHMTPYCPNPAGGDISVWDIDELKILGSSSTEAVGGSITGGPFTFCVGDNIPDNIPVNAVTATGNSGTNSQWLVTDVTGMTILGLPSSPSEVNFEEAGPGTCLLWNLSYTGGITGLTVNGPVAAIDGCYSISNSLIVNRIVNGEACQNACMVAGGFLSGGPFSFCIGDGIADHIDSSAVSLTGASGANSQWVITNESGTTILGLPTSPSVADFETAGLGTCRLWHLSYDGQLDGAVVGGLVSDLSGCISLSNSLVINRSQPDGGLLTGGPFTFCVGDNIADNLSMDAISISNMSGEGSQWLVTDASGATILGLPNNPTEVDFDGQGPGQCLIWHLSYNGALTGAVLNGPVSGLGGCFDLSNHIEVNRVQPQGGTLTGGPFTFCVGDGIPDNLTADAITLTGQSGANTQWVVTDQDTTTILGLPALLSDVNFDITDAGTCLIWNLSYDGELSGAMVNSPVSGLRGCLSLSNSVAVTREINGASCDALCNVAGGTLSGGNFAFCIGDGIPDTLAADALSLTGQSGANSQWVITDIDTNMILGLPSTYSNVDFDTQTIGSCLIWHLSYDGELTGATVGSSVSGLNGCFSLSNSIVVNRETTGPICDALCNVEGGTISGGPFNFCVNDDIPDTLTAGDINLTGQLGANSQWVITDIDTNIILGLPPSLTDADFDTAGLGTCLIWHLSFEGELTGATVNSSVSGINGCFSLSNSIVVRRETSGSICDAICNVAGGSLAGGPFNFCVGDGVADTLLTTDITLTGNRGENRQWLITDDQGIILELPDSLTDINFENSPTGICLIWSVSYKDSLIGAELGLNAGDMTGCISLSTSVTVMRVDQGANCFVPCETEGGTLAGGPFSFCVGDGITDTIATSEITLSDNSGSNSQWLVTNEQGRILGLPDNFSSIEFDTSGFGTCLIWHLSFEDSLVGLQIGRNANNLQGCFSLSDSISVTRNQPDGGRISGGPFTFCAGDGIVDTIPRDSIGLNRAVGANSTWLVTNNAGSIILGFAETLNQIDFDSYGAGRSRLWNVNYDGELLGLQVDSLVSGISGCFDISNAISIIHNQPVGGTITGGPFSFCVGDGTADTIPEGMITLTGNAGTNSQWVITNADTSQIISLPNSPFDVDFDGAGAGECLVWHLSYDGDITGAELNMPVSGLGGCFSLSNGIRISREIDGTACMDSSCVVTRSTITGGPFNYCVGDSLADTIADTLILVSGNTATNFQWVVTDADTMTILELPDSPSDIDFDGSGVGTCLIWLVTYEGTLEGAVKDSAVSGLSGCFQLSNSIAVVRDIDGAACVNAACMDPEGGTLSGGPFTFCVGDALRDTIATGEVTVTGNTGTNSQWVITDTSATTILGLPTSLSDFNFEIAGTEPRLIWHLSYDGNLSGLEIDSTIMGIQGCYDLSSNSIRVIRNQSAGGMISGGPFTFCVGDGVVDTIASSDIELTGNVGENSQWLLTDESTTTILGIAATLGELNFNNLTAGTCQLWHLSYYGDLSGATVNGPVVDLSGCFALSNSLNIVHVDDGDLCDPGCTAEGGNLTGGPFGFCVGDGVADIIPDEAVTITGASGDSSQWIITDLAGVIMTLPNSIEDVNFDNAGAGTCLIYLLSYNGTLTGVEVSSSVSDLSGCYKLSDSLRVVRNEPINATLTGGPFTFCVGDGTPDLIPTSSVTISGNTGSNFQWVVLDSTGTIILSIIDSYDNINFDTTGVGTCFIKHISYDGQLQGLEANAPLTGLSGCYSLSNNLVVERSNNGSACAADCVVMGGNINGSPFQFCVGDGLADTIAMGEVTLSGQVGSVSSWIVTDETGTTILDVVSSPSDLNFDGSGVGTCQLWHMSSEGVIQGDTIEGPLSGIQGCHRFSNSIAIVRSDSGEVCGDSCRISGGTLSGGPFMFCAEDGIIDTIPDQAITVTGNSGPNALWVVTDETATTILELPGSPSSVNFDTLGTGSSLIWLLSFEDDLSGATKGAMVSDLGGCFSFSDSLVITRNQPIGGTVTGGPFTFCSGDGVVDTIVAGDVTLEGEVGTGSQWIVTDENGEAILGLLDSPSDDNFDTAPPGICLIFHVSYIGELPGLVSGGSISDLEGCFSLSESVVINRVDSGDECENTGVTGPNIVINEIIFDGNLVELKNTGTTPADISSYYLCNWPQYENIGGLNINCGTNFILGAGETLVVESGLTINAADGEMGLYLNNTDYTNPNNIIDYVEWNAGGHTRSVIAVMAGIWSAGDFVATPDSTMSLNYDGMGNASTDWTQASATPCDTESNLTSVPDRISLQVLENPVLDYLYFNVNMVKDLEEITVDIHDIFGNRVKTERIALNFYSTEIHKIDISSLSQGLYFISTQEGYGRVEAKIVKQ